MSLLDHMCPKCNYYMPLGPDTTVEEVKPGDLARFCRNCGHTEEEKKGLVMEMVIQEKITDSYKIFVNEFTKQDPRLPHVGNLQCPNTGPTTEFPNRQACPSRQPGGKPDVVYMKYDTSNMKFLYICNICNTQWKSRS